MRSWMCLERPRPVPETGQVRIEVLRCGICGSDLHARHGCDAWAELAERAGYRRFARSQQQIVFGREFCGEVAEHGPRCRKDSPEGTRVVALPLLRNGQDVDTVGLSQYAPGAFAEQMLVQESLMMPVPNGLSWDIAALTEPMAVAWHAVRRGEVGKRTVAIVVGCGPIGLAVILHVEGQGRAHGRGQRLRARATCARARLRGERRARPRAASPSNAVQRRGHLEDIPSAFGAGRRTRARNWGVCPSAGGTLGAWERRSAPRPRHPVIFECVGMPGVIESIIDGAPLFSRVVVVGVCVGVDQITPAMAINKEIDLRFVFGYTPLEFRDTLQMLAEGEVDPSPLITGTVGLDGVDAAFSALASPERHAKILIDPASSAAAPVGL